MTTKIQRRIYGHTTDMEIRPLDEQKAVQAATDLIGEAFIFSVLLETRNKSYVLLHLQIRHMDILNAPLMIHYFLLY